MISSDAFLSINKKVTTIIIRYEYIELGVINFTLKDFIPYSMVKTDSIAGAAATRHSQPLSLPHNLISKANGAIA